MDVSIRAMTVGDVSAVYALGARSYDVGEPPYNYWSREEVEHHLATSPALCFVAESGGEVIGFLLGADTFERIEDAAHLEWVAVALAHRRSGVAGRLLDAAVEAARALGKTRAFADVAADNDESLRLVGRHGFEPYRSVTYFAKRL